MTDIRAKQNMEVLDIWGNLGSQVTGLTNKQVQQFQESIKPKTQRDLGAEVNVDKAVENMNKTIETKLGALEFVVQNINPENRGASSANELTTAQNRNVFYSSLAQANNTGDLIPLWNSIVRAYQDSGINRETQQVIKVKVQELTPNLEAMNYGLNQSLDTIFSVKIMSVSFAGTVLELLRTYSVYNELKAQVESNPPRFELLTVDLLDRAFKNIYETQSNERLKLLSEYAPRGLASSSTIRNIPDFKTGDYEKRIKELENEVGFKIPRVVVDRLRNLSGKDLQTALIKIRNETIPQNKRAISREDIDLLQQLQREQHKLDDYLAEEGMLEAHIVDLEDEIRALRDGVLIELRDIENRLEDEPEEPVEPDYPDVADYADDDIEAFIGVMEEYAVPHAEFIRLTLERNRIIAHNRAIRDLAVETEAERRQILFNLMRELQDTRDDLMELEGELIPQQQDEVRQMITLIRQKRAGRAGRNQHLFDLMDVIFESKKVQEIKKKPRLVPRRRVEPDSEADEKGSDSDSDSDGSSDTRSFYSETQSEEEDEVGRGKGFERRGQGSMNRHYGYKDINPRKDNVMNYDDRRNDSYTKKR
jgi:hypothetical protein